MRLLLKSPAIKVRIEAWTQLIGVLGPLGGLVIVGLEMTLLREIAARAQHQARKFRAQSQLASS